RGRLVAQCLLEPPGRGADRVQERRAREPRRNPDRALELERRFFRLVDPFGVLGEPQREERRSQLLELPTPRGLRRELAERRDRDGAPHERSLPDDRALGVERDPRSPDALEGTEVDAAALLRL